jgi:hypothetical protein
MKGASRRLSVRVATLCGAAVLLVAALTIGLSIFGGSSNSKPQPSRSDGAMVIWAVGDGADGGDTAKRLAAAIHSGRIDQFLYLGDVYEKGTARDFTVNYNGVYGALSRITLPTPGNHEWGRRAEGYSPYWQRIKGEPPPAYYEARLGGWTILSLNSEVSHTRIAPQIRWLRRTVLSSSGTCRLAFWHRPRYSAGRYSDARDIEPFWDVLRGHAAIVVNGHDHNMQRFEPLNGITEFVSGAGGKQHYAVERNYARLAFANDTDWGALRFELAPGTARWKFVSARGGILDAGTLRCNPR